MELYAMRRFTFDCVKAAKLPMIIVSNAMDQSSGVQRGLRDPKPVIKIRRSTAKAAAFGPADMNALTGLAAPWYTSGAQIWNGAAETLNKRPIRINAAAMPVRTTGGRRPGSEITRCISFRFVEPVRP